MLRERMEISCIPLPERVRDKFTKGGFMNVEGEDGNLLYPPP